MCDVVIIELVVLSTAIRLSFNFSYLEGEMDSILMKEKDRFFAFLSMSKQ